MKIKNNLSPWKVLFLGFLTGYLFLIHVRNIGLMSALLVLSTVRIRNQSQASLMVGHFASGFALALFLRTAINFYLWERFLTSAAAGWKTSYTSFVELFTAPPIRLFRWIFDWKFGLLRYAPIYLSVFPGFLRAYQESKNTFFELVFLILCYILPVTIPNTVNPGWSPAGRFLVPIIPFVILGMSFYFKKKEKNSLCSQKS